MPEHIFFYWSPKVPMVPQLVPPLQIQVFLPELWLWQPEADSPLGCIPDKQDSYHSANVPVRHEHSAKLYYHENPDNRHISSERHNIPAGVP